MAETRNLCAQIPIDLHDKVKEEKDALGLALSGCVIFTLCTFVFTSIQDRLSSGPAAKASAFFSAVSLYMASQCFIGMIL